MATRLVVTISQCIQMKNHYTERLKPIQYCILSIHKKYWKTGNVVQIIRILLTHKEHTNTQIYHHGLNCSLIIAELMFLYQFLSTLGIYKNLIIWITSWVSKSELLCQIMWYIPIPDSIPRLQGESWHLNPENSGI